MYIYIYTYIDILFPWEIKPSEASTKIERRAFTEKCINDIPFYASVAYGSGFMPQSSLLIAHRKEKGAAGPGA